MRRILLTIISLLPLLSYGQSMKIAPKQIEPGDDGQAVITRNGVNVLDSIKWADVSGKPTDLERTSNKVNNLNNPNNTTYPTTQAVMGNFVSLIPNSDNSQSANYSGDLNDLIGINQFNFNGGNALNKPPFFPYGGVLYNHAITTNLGTQMALGWASSSGGDFFAYRSKNSGVWSDWYRVASQDWVNSQGFLTSETDPVYTSDKPNIIFSGDNNSLLNNDAGYITSASIPSLYISNDPTNTLNPQQTNDFPTITSYDDVEQSIVYANSGLTNGPAMNGSLLTVYNKNTKSYGGQFVIGYDGSGYIRGKSSNNWGNWKSLAFTDDIPNPQTLSLSGHDLSLSGGGGTVTIPDNNTTYTAGTGLSLSGTTFNNTAPDKTVVLNTGTGISVSGTYPNFTITNTAPNQNYTLPTASASVLGGIKVGNNLSISSGVLSADVGTNDLFSGDYNDLTNKPTIPTVNNGTLTLATGTGLTGSQTFTANSSTNKTFTVGLNAALNNLNDVSASSPSSGQLLRYNGTSWANWTPNFLTSFTETDPVYTADKPNVLMYKGTLGSSDDLNDKTETGIYFCLINNYATTALHYPENGAGGVLEVIKYPGDARLSQRFTVGASQGQKNVYIRNKYGTSWFGWTKLANGDDIPSPQTLSINGQNLTISNGNTVTLPGTNLGGNFNPSSGNLTVTSSTGSNATIGMPALQSGDYAPSVYNLSGFTNVTPSVGGGYDFIYSQVGQVVTVSGSFEYTTDGSGGSTIRTFDFDPPIPATQMQAWGTGSYGVKTNGANASVIGVSNRLRITLWDENNSTNQVYFTCQYIVD